MMTKNEGMMIVPNMQETSIPPNITVPSERRLAHPAPVAITSGITPSTNVTEVIKTARNLK